MFVYTWSATQSLGWRHVNTGLITIIICKLDQGKMLLPRSAKVNHARQEPIFKDLDNLLRLAIDLRWIGHAELGFHTMFSLKGSPERRCVLNIIYPVSPRSRTIWSQYILTNANTRYVVQIGMKCANFVNMSTTTHTPSIWRREWGNWVTKSHVT